ncbi:MAG: DUF4363 family protein [Clostridia bacterium]|nr:DUF4363 family protein [Clostridia bacterium]
MKRLWAAAAFAVIVAIICSIGIYCVNSYSKGLISRLDMASDAAKSGDLTKATALSQQAEDYWISAEKVLGLFVSHNEISQIGVSISKLPSLIENGDKALFLAELSSAKIQIIHTTKMEIPIDIN